MTEKSTQGRYIGMAKLGPKSQIVIPKEVREMFSLAPGDSILILADPDQGIALVDPDDYTDLIDAAFTSKSIRGDGE